MSDKSEHGITIGINRVNDCFFIKMKIVGTLTHEDYELITPMLEKSLSGVKEPNISLVIDALEFTGWSLEAIWDDLKLGLEHNGEFKKIAFIGNKSWQEYGVKISNLFSLGVMQYFEDCDSALVWLSQEEAKEEFVINNTKDMTEKEILSRQEAIENQLELLFKANMKITDWDVPEADDKKAALMIHDILQKKLKNIKLDIDDGKYDNY